MPNPEPGCASTLPLCGKTFGFIFSAVTGQILSRNVFQFSDIEKLAIFSEIYNEKKNPKKLQNVSQQNSMIQCVMKVGLQGFAYINSLY